MDFLKDIFGTAKGPQVLPGATPPPSKGADITQLLARLLGAGAAGMGAMGGGVPQAGPNLLAQRLRQRSLETTAKGNTPMSPQQDTIGALLKRIFQPTNEPVSSGMPKMLGGGPPDKIGTGTGGLY